MSWNSTFRFPGRPLRKVSPALAQKNAEYEKVVRKWWAGRLKKDGGRCQFAEKGVRCQRKASNRPHHTEGRGRNLCNAKTFKALCWIPHHVWVHGHPNEARRKGLLK